MKRKESKPGRFEFIHALVTAGETNWVKIWQILLTHNPPWVMIGKRSQRLVEVKSLRRGYAAWLRGRRAN